MTERAVTERTILDLWNPRTEAAVLARSPSWESHLHGRAHWFRVARNGLSLAAETPGQVDVKVVLLFGLFHDSMRFNDDADPDHGRRGGMLAYELAPLDGTRLAKLVYACAWHADGRITEDPTVGCCWDADRLDLPRVGIDPEPQFMSTEAGKRRAS